MKKLYKLALAGILGFLSYSSSNAQCSATINATNVTCFGACNGRAIAMPTGGVAPYTYSWSPSGGSSDTAKNLCAGTYTVTVTDAAVCNTTAVVTINQPTALSITMGANSSTCSCTGTLMAAGNGGTPLYTYSWSPSGGSGPSANNLCPGRYLLHLTDGNGCVDTASGLVTHSAPPSMSIVSQTNVKCGGMCTGKTTLTTTGGTSPYTYSWSGSAITGPTDSMMCAASYSVTVTDV
ncbi:MAG: SprB repeat-containing protein, partial [Bacteroidia bacterium]